MAAIETYSYHPQNNPESDMFIDIAVTSDFSTWNKFRFNVRDWTNPWLEEDMDEFARIDFSGLAVDADYLYFTAWWQDGTGFVTSPVWIIGKNELLENGTEFVQLYQHFNADDALKFNHRAIPQPVVNLSPNGEPQYFLGVDPGNPGTPTEYYPNDRESQDPHLAKVFNEITIHAVQVLNPTEIEVDHFPLELIDPATSTALKYRIPKNTTVIQPSPTVRGLRLESPRFWTQPVFRDDYLWAAHHVRLESSDEIRTRWYRIKMNGWPVSNEGEPELEAWGEIDPTNETAIFPSVSVNFLWDMLVSYGVVGSGSNEFIRPQWTLLPWGGTTSLGWIPIDCSGCTLGVFNVTSGNPLAIKWGDFSATAADPTDWCAFWTYQPWAKGGAGNDDNWQTWLSKESMTALCSQEFGPDYNGDSVVDEYDILEFNALFNASSRRADFNRDRVLDALDYAAFMDAWTRGQR